MGLRENLGLEKVRDTGACFQLAKTKGVNNPSQKRGTGAESQAEVWIMGGCELVSSARGSRNLLAPSHSREQVEKFHEENLSEEIYRNEAFHNRAGW